MDVHVGTLWHASGPLLIHDPKSPFEPQLAGELAGDQEEVPEERLIGLGRRGQARDRLSGMISR